MTRKVGRPQRLDNHNRQQLLTFYPAALRSDIKVLATMNKMSMSDYMDSNIMSWLQDDTNQNVQVYRTHPRSGSDENWVSVQLVLSDATYTKLKESAVERDVSVASLVYTISKNIVQTKAA